MYRIRPRDQSRDQRVTSLMIGSIPLLILTDDHALSLFAHEELVLCLIKVAHLDLVLILPGSQKSRLIDKVGKIGA